MTFTAKLTGSGGIQSQSGQIALNNSGNDYSGGTTINGGLINFNNANSFGSGLITVGTSGSALIAEATGITVPNNFSNSLVASLNLSATGSPFTTTFSGNWNLVGNMLSLGAGGGTVNTVILSGVLSGTGAFGRQSSTTHGTIRLTGANTYTGKSSFQSSVTSVSSLNSVTTPAQQTSSSLGKPSNAANGTLAFGATTFTGTLLYTGVGETTDRVIDLAGTTGGGIIQNDGTGALTFTAVNTASGVGAKTLTLQGAYAASANTISGAIVNSSSGATSLTKAGAGSWTLTGVNTFSGGIAVSGGTLTVGGAGQLNSGSYGGVISGGGTFTYNSAASQILSGNSTFTGTFNLNSGAIGVGNSGTFGAAGATVNINGGKFGNTAGTGRTIPSGVTLNINADFTVDDSFFTSSANGQILFNGGTATLKNGNRTINVNQPNGQTVNLGIANVIGQDVAGRGIIKTGSGILALTGANTYSGDTTISGGQININGTSTLGDGTGTLHLSGGALNTTATRTASTAPVANPIDVTADSSITTSSTAATVDLNLSSSSIGGSAGTLTFKSTSTGGFKPRFSGSGFIFSRPIVIDNGSGSTVLQSFNATGTDQTFSGAISGNGIFNRTASSVGTGGRTIFSATVGNTYSGGTTVNDGILLVNNSTGSGTGSGAVTVNSGGTLGGTGTIGGLVTVNSGGTLSPGASIGTLTLSNAPSLSGTTLMEIDHAGLPNADKLVVLPGRGTLTYGGTLTVVNNGATLTRMDTFDLFDADALSGTFTALNLPSVPTGLTWNTSQLTVDGTIKVVCDGTLTANAGANQTICSGGSVGIGGSPTASGGSGGTYTYSWSPSTGLSSTSVANPTASPTNTTMYTVTVTDTNGCLATSPVTVTVNTVPSISSGPTPSSQAACNGFPASVSISASGGSLNYAWRKRGTGWGASGAWTLSTGSGSGAFYIGSSTDNDNFESASNGGNDINTSGKAWGIYNSGGVSDAVRNFSSLAVGRSVSLDVDNGSINGTVGFGVQNSSGENRLEFYFHGGDANYTVNDGATHDSGIGFTREGVNVTITLTGTDSYSITIKRYIDNATATLTGTLEGTPGTAISRIRLFNADGGGGTDHNLYFNNLTVDGYDDSAANYTAWNSGDNFGDSPLTNGGNISGADTATLTINPAGAGDVGSYDVVIYNSCGQTVSSAASLTLNSRPTAVVSGDATICSGSSTIISAALTGMGPWTVTWSDGFSHSVSSSPDNRSVSPSVTTTYTVTALTDANCASQGGDLTGSAAVTVNPPATVSAGPNQTVCASSPAVTLAGSFGGAASTATWSGGAGSFNPNNTTTNATYTPTAGEISAGAVTLTLTTDDPAGPCGPVNASMTITINPAATVSAGPDQIVCAGGAVSLAGAFGGAATNATWTTAGTGSFDDATLTNATYTPSAADIAAGTVTLTLTTGDPAGPCGPVNDSMLVTFDKVTATNVTYLRNASSSFKISKTNLLSNASDTDAEAISLAGVGTDGANMLTTNGVTLTTDANWIFYTNSVTPDVNDSFQYQVTDARGCLALGTVFIQVVQNETGQGTSVTVSNGVATVGFAGVPGRAYQIQRSTNLTDWATLVTTNAPTNGVFQWADNFSDLGVPPADPPASAYYRLRVP